ncbi:MAG TPA: hypothetical protein VF574_05270 [Allosphingosinicella sp.]
MAAWLSLLLMAADPSSDARALDPATAAAIVEPLEKCLRQRIADHRVEPAQLGSDEAARNFATWQMSRCGDGDVQARLIAAMRSADPGLSAEEALQRTGAMLGSVLSTAAMQASERFKVTYQVPIEMIDCPPGREPRPEACGRKTEVSSAKPIDVPFQAIEPFYTYQRCVLDRFDIALRSVRNFEQARQAHFDSVAACRDVRAVQLARALELVTDRRIYGSRAKALAMARLAFDRFDTEFDMEWGSSSPPPAAGPGRSN